MSITFESIIEEIKGSPDAEAVIAALLAKKKELGPDATEEAIVEAIKEVLVQFSQKSSESAQAYSPAADEPALPTEPAVTPVVQISSSSDSDDDEISVSDEDKEALESAAESVRAVMARKKWKYSESKIRADYVKFELNFNCDSCKIKMRVYVETNPNACRIDAILPITGDQIYEYPLCKLLVKENYSRRYGAFQYDERDGEITYRYSFSTQAGLDGTVFEKAFIAVLNTADDCFPKIRRCAVGRFTSAETDEIINKVNALITDLDE